MAASQRVLLETATPLFWKGEFFRQRLTPSVRGLFSVVEKGFFFGHRYIASNITRGAKMRVLISIDDTDNLESRGTGEIASLIAAALQEKGWGKTGMVTRHQLLVHPDIPYTSHNSAMCFPAEIAEGCLDQVVAFAGDFLDRESAAGSDPGLCVAPLGRLVDLSTAAGRAKVAGDELIAFGLQAKREVLSMQRAFELAGRLGVHLSEHGGTGQGVIGALAGAGLRLYGNDGRMKGALDFGGRTVLRVAELLDHPDVDEVRPMCGAALNPAELVEIGEKPKTVLQQGASVLLVTALSREGSEAAWQTVHRKQLRGY